MGVTMLIKGQNTPGQAPTAAQVKVRELLVDQSSGTLYTQKIDGTIRTINPAYGPAPQSLTVEFTTPLAAYTFVTAVAGVTLGNQVFCSVSGQTPSSNAFADEFEMEPMQAFGMVYAPGAIAFTLTCCDSQLLTMGKKTILYYVG